MFDILNLVFAAGVVASNVALYSSNDYKAPAAREGIVAVSLHREFYREDGQGKCEFTGVMVPFVRDWDEVRTAGDGDHETVLPADPNTTAGMAFLVNQRICEGKEPEQIFRAGDKYRLKEGGNFYKKHVVMASDMLSTPPEQRPKWLPQVLDRLTRLAANDEAAAQFLRTSQLEIAKLRSQAQ
ncbi:MAG: hypothetical protein EOP24_36950 [Hyphomicrobiales bacterium]|nr:MAG: hypothetical protein EOP24_36950 [Hyphomicrobiales bacterium]